jgi:hypothetical protein
LGGGAVAFPRAVPAVEGEVVMSGKRAKQLRRLVGLAAADSRDTFGRWFLEVCRRPRWERVKFAWRVFKGR